MRPAMPETWLRRWRPWRTGTAGSWHLLTGLDDLGPWRLLMLPDHATPLTTRTHSPDPVPYLLADSAADGPGGTFTEAGVADREPVPGHLLVPHLLAS